SRGDRWGTPAQPGVQEILNRLATPNAERVWYIRYAFKAGLPVEEIHRLTRIDRWFLYNIRDLIEMEDRIREMGDPARRARDEAATRALLLQAKQYGFSDRQIAY